jgi:ABC-type multidrug transport system fused ATPase/permease subunit
MKFLKEGDAWTVIISRLTIGIVLTLSGLAYVFNIEPISPWILSHYELLGLTPGGFAANAINATSTILGILMINNLFVPTTLLVSIPILTTIVAANFKISFLFGFISCLLFLPIYILARFYRKIFKIFLRPQTFVNPMAENTSDIIIVEEAREKLNNSDYADIKKLSNKLRSIV